MPTETDTRRCTHFGCLGTQRFSEMAAGWECSVDNEHFEAAVIMDFSAEGRASRIDAILNDLHLLEQEAATNRDAAARERLQGHVRSLIASVKAERAYINFPMG